MKGHLKPRGKDTWGIVIELGKDPTTGKRRQTYQTFHGGKRAAEAELNRLLYLLHTGQYVEPNRLTVAVYLQRWLEYTRPKVAGRTIEIYEDTCEKHLILALGHLLLTQLRPLHVEEYHARARESGRRDGKGGLSPQTVLHHHRVLHRAVDQAVKWQLLAVNPLDAVETPRKPHHNRQILDADQMAHLLDAADGTRLYLPILLAVTTGMRRGEILGLRWQDVNLQARSLTVLQTLERTRAGTAFKQPKTHRSTRPIDLSPVVIDALLRQRADQAQRQLLAGPAYHDHGLVVAQENGEPMGPHAFSVAFADLVDRAGVPDVTFHGLRHTHFSHCIQAGVPMKVISERAGHTGIGITMDLYGHLLPGMQQEAAEKTGAALEAAIQRRKKGA